MSLTVIGQRARPVATAATAAAAAAESPKHDAPAAAAAAMKKAEEQAAGQRDKILAQAAKDCEKLKSDARARMDKAAQAIIGRVVER